MSDYKKAVYYSDNNFSLIVELIDDVPFIHLQVKKFSKSILETIRKKWAEVKALAYFDGYEAIYTYTQDERVFKFSSPTRVLDGGFNLHGKEYRVAEWDLK